ncbi:RHS repeat protein [Paraburkholderia strydomiana]|uniref:RHS repeat protein n=1 Tax=Paraburkholderia strydomiana TaxID=1245417 RepID=A0ABW9CCH0_9BURK
MSPSGNATRYAYDGNGNLVSVTAPHWTRSSVCLLGRLLLA